MVVKMKMKMITPLTWLLRENRNFRRGRVNLKRPLACGRIVSAADDGDLWHDMKTEYM